MLLVDIACSVACDHHVTVYIDHIMGSVWSGVYDYYTGGVHCLSGQGVSTKNDQLTGVDIQHSMHTQKH